ncbi:MAG: Aminotransferase class I and II [Parcubacteria group bacterium GW2011_GWA2_44_12]|nr:MAG: Aminotransferase class I and II [Parcubacteria group bacterium GW2011_GWA2_44_12]
MISLSHIARSISSSATLALNAKAQELRLLGHDVINLSVGEPNFPSSEAVKRAGIEAIKANFTKYTPESGIAELREAVASFYANEYGISSARKEHVIISNGGKQILAMLFAVLLNHNDEVLVPSPYWTSYPEQIKIASGSPIFVETDKNFIIRASALAKKITRKTKLILVNSPSNPTGAIIPETELRKILALAKKHTIMIISDEVYSELYFTNKKPRSIASFAKNPFEHVIIASSVSKSAAMTGWRIGYAIAHETIIKQMGAYQSHFSSAPCGVAQKAALQALNSEAHAYTEQMRQAFKKRRDTLVRKLTRIEGITLVPPRGAFYAFCKISTDIMKKTHNRFTESLLEKEYVAVVPGTAFGSTFKNAFRLSLAVDESVLEEGMRRIKRFVEG